MNITEIKKKLQFDMNKVNDFIANINEKSLFYLQFLQKKM